MKALLFACLALFVVPATAQAPDPMEAMLSSAKLIQFSMQVIINKIPPENQKALDAAFRVENNKKNNRINTLQLVTLTDEDQDGPYQKGEKRFDYKRYSSSYSYDIKNLNNAQLTPIQRRSIAVRLAAVRIIVTAPFFLEGAIPIDVAPSMEKDAKDNIREVMYADMKNTYDYLDKQWLDDTTDFILGVMLQKMPLKDFPTYTKNLFLDYRVAEVGLESRFGHPTKIHDIYSELVINMTNRLWTIAQQCNQPNP